MFLVGVATGGQTIFEVGAAIGALSLVAALAWRADLVSSWRKSHQQS
jgi:hypothetical protein